MKILVFGSTGQVAESLRDVIPARVDVTFLGRNDCDLADAGNVRENLALHEPDWVINAAAYTQVDKAEEEPDVARSVNADAVGAMAEFVAERKARLVHISTDFVFGGSKTEPYKPGDPTGPLGEYGASKLAGEVAALKAAPENTMIIRTAWVYSEHGSNFVKTMLRLMAAKEELGVVNDQRGTPTYANGLAEVISQIVTSDRFQPGIYHWTDAGETSWYEFAVAIQEEGIARSLLDREILLKPIATEDYPTPAARPAYSVLDSSKLADLLGLEPIRWRDQLISMMSRLAD